MNILSLAISILLNLQNDGSAVVTENWDIDVSRGTEIYLVRENLGDITISDFSVSENGQNFISLDRWLPDETLEYKAGKCGINKTGNGCELCWGIGSYGHHTFTARYRMNNAVKSLRDYDMLHLQLVSPGIEPSPDNVSISISGPVSFNESNTRLWGFGFEGTSAMSSDGCAVFSSTEKFSSRSSVIVLLRFEKGIFSSSSILDEDFGTHLDRALEGASFSDDAEEDSPFEVFIAFLVNIIAVIVIIFCVKGAWNFNKKRILGCKEKDVQWFRDIPCGGDILKADYILGQLGDGSRGNIASAMILRMIDAGFITVGTDIRGNVELSFNPAKSPEELQESERALYLMMKEASGKDVILQKNEFKRWSNFHIKRVSSWVNKLGKEGESRCHDAGFITGRDFNEQGQRSARELVGFRKFLKDFTLLDERHSLEVSLWHDYLVFASLFGIAEHVAKELREIDPRAFEQAFPDGYDTTWQVLYMTRILANSITNAHTTRMTGASRSGLGGVTSFGGGGGFHGGGFGGGVR